MKTEKETIDKEPYAKPKVLATYEKEDLERIIRPHGGDYDSDLYELDEYDPSGCGCGCGCS